LVGRKNARTLEKRVLLYNTSDSEAQKIHMLPQGKGGGGVNKTIHVNKLGTPRKKVDKPIPGDHFLLSTGGIEGWPLTERVPEAKMWAQSGM